MAEAEAPSGTSGRALATAGLMLTLAALASRILGWLRLLVIGSQFGASRELDAYFAAFRIPDAIFQLVVAGALSAALIPVFAGYRARGQEDEAWRVASSVINLVLIGLVVLSSLMIVLAPWLVPAVVAPGFDAETTRLAVGLTQLMLLSPIFVGLGAVVSGLLNSYQRFALPAIAPLVYNLAIIAAAITLAPSMGVTGLAVGVVAGSALHLAIQLPQLRDVGNRYRPRIGLGDPGVRQVVRLMGPRLLGLGAGQLNFIVTTMLASGLVVGSLTAYNYAFQLSQIPVGVLGVSVAIALFPTLSSDAALGRVAEIRRQVAASLRLLVFLAAPLTAAMLVLAGPIAAVFFQYGLFTSEASQRTASVLAYFAIGLVGHVVVHVLTRAFYAMQDTRTPVLWAGLAVAMNIALMLALVGPMGVEGLALAVSISAVAEVIGLLWALRDRLESLEEARVGAAVGQAALAGMAAAGVMFGALRLAEAVAAGLMADGLARAAVLLGLLLAGGATYLASAALMRSAELRQLAGYLRPARANAA